MEWYPLGLRCRGRLDGFECGGRCLGGALEMVGHLHLLLVVLFLLRRARGLGAMVFLTIANPEFGRQRTGDGLLVRLI